MVQDWALCKGKKNFALSMSSFLLPHFPFPLPLQAGRKELIQLVKHSFQVLCRQMAFVKGWLRVSTSRAGS